MITDSTIGHIYRNDDLGIVLEITTMNNMKCLHCIESARPEVWYVGEWHGLTHGHHSTWDPQYWRRVDKAYNVLNLYEKLRR